MPEVYVNVYLFKVLTLLAAPYVSDMVAKCANLVVWYNHYQMNVWQYSLGQSWTIVACYLSKTIEVVKM
jgi:hypothetical protein